MADLKAIADPDDLFTEWVELIAHRNEDFVIGKDDFGDLEVSPTASNDRLYYFYHRGERRLIKQFVLKAGAQVDYLCVVTLIKKDDKFTPRIAVSVRDKNKAIVEGQQAAPTNIRARVSLDDCHTNFWQLMNFLRTFHGLEVPQGSFSLMSQNDSEIVAALRGRDAASVKNVIQQLAAGTDLGLSQKDMNVLMKRREKLAEFELGMTQHSADERWWQRFLDQNKWIFGYGLNYVILQLEQAQPNVGGTTVDGTGAQRSDNLMKTAGDLSFTVLVELKTPATALVQGTAPIRSGAYSLGRGLTDAVSQNLANIQTWEKEGSELRANRDRLETAGVYTVKPKGIIVVGTLGQLTDRDRRETFQRFRASLHGVDVMTFDELLARARYIVEND